MQIIWPAVVRKNRTESIFGGLEQSSLLCFLMLHIQMICYFRFSHFLLASNKAWELWESKGTCVCVFRALSMRLWMCGRHHPFSFPPSEPGSELCPSPSWFIQFTKQSVPGLADVTQPAVSQWYRAEYPESLSRSCSLTTTAISQRRVLEEGQECRGRMDALSYLDPTKGTCLQAFRGRREAFYPFAVSLLCFVPPYRAADWRYGAALQVLLGGQGGGDKARGWADEPTPWSTAKVILLQWSTDGRTPDVHRESHSEVWCARAHWDFKALQPTPLNAFRSQSSAHKAVFQQLFNSSYASKT